MLNIRGSIFVCFVCCMIELRNVLFKFNKSVSLFGWFYSDKICYESQNNCMLFLYTHLIVYFSYTGSTISLPFWVVLFSSCGTSARYDQTDKCQCYNTTIKYWYFNSYYFYWKSRLCHAVHSLYICSMCALLVWGCGGVSCNSFFSFFLYKD